MSRRVARPNPAAWVAAALALALSAPALAGPGDHVRLGGSATLTPSLGVGFEFETNPYRSDTETIPGVHLALEPGLRIQADGPDAKFELGGVYSLDKYFQDRLTALDRFSNFDIDGKLHLFPDRTFGLQLADRVSLQGRNTERPGASIAYNNQFRNGLEGAIVLAAGPVLSFEPGGQWGYDEYFVADFFEGGLRPYNFRHSYGPTFSAEWSFFPLTTLRLEGEYTWNRWNENWVPTGNQNSELGSEFGLPDSEMWKARLGIKGRFTARLVLVAMIGYGQAYYDEQSVIDDGGSADGVDVDLKDARGILAQVQLGWQLGPREQVKVGYQRDFTDSWFTNFLVYDEVFVGTDLRFGSRIGLNALAKLRFEGYNGALERNDMFIRANLGGAYYLKDWASIDLRLTWDQRLSTGQGVAFMDFGTFAGATFTY